MKKIFGMNLRINASFIGKIIQIKKDKSFKNDTPRPEGRGISKVKVKH